ncbi:phage nozzle protein [Burkholderia multivorans]
MPIDGLLQPRIGSLHAGVSRQAPLLRSPSQMDEIINFLPSVEIGGLADRVGTACIANIAAAPYKANGTYMFRTTDGRRWLFIRRADQGYPEIRNLDNGTPAEVTVGPFAQSYINTGEALKFLTLADTTLVLNPSVTARFVAPPTGVTKTRAYAVIRKLPPNYQSFYLSSDAGSAVQVYDGRSATQSREWVAQKLMEQCIARMPGLTFWRIANVIKIEGPENIIATLNGGNDWDEAAFVLIKGRVSAISDLPSQMFHGEPILVDLGNGDAKSSYWVTYDRTTNSYKETSWLDNFATSGNWDKSTMPMRIHQTGANSFEIQPIDWVPRKAGDDDSNAPAPFKDAPITDMALWKGRLWFSSSSWVIGSQPDDLFNFWQSSAREVVASDPVKVQAEADLGNVNHLVGFRDDLMVFMRGAQCALDGSQPVKPDTAALGVATRYNVDDSCPPEVVGTVLLYTGSQEGHSVLWEYQYEQAVQNNYAEDLSKHIPRYCPGSIRRIVGSAQSGRTFLWTPLDPATLYVQTSYWKGQERAQNAWCKLNFAHVTSIWHHWVDEGTLYVLAQTSIGYLSLLSMPVDANLGENPNIDLRLDMRQPIQVTWNEARNRSEVVLPDGYYQHDGLVVCTPDSGGWFAEHEITKVWDGKQWIGHFPEMTRAGQCYIGLRFSRSFRFSPFYPSVGQSTTPMGRFQVHKVLLDCLRSGDFTATLTRPDRMDMVVQLTPRTVGDALVANDGEDKTYAIPFNSQGNKATLTVATDSTAPMVVTGYTLAARYSNLFANA